MKRKVTNKDIKKAIRGVMNEGHDSYMAKSQLYNIARKAQSMYDQLEKGEPLEDWMESNIAKMDNMMDSVSDSFSYDQHQERSCPDGMYWCGKDQICKPDSQDMSVIVSTQEMNEDYEMADTYSRSSFKPTPRETQLSGAFGKYGEDIPPAVIRYIRKNPRLVLKNLADIYGDKIYDYIPPKVEQEINEAIGFTKSYEGELDGHIDDFIDVVCGFISEQVKEKSLYGDEIVVQRLYQLLTDGGELHSSVQELVDILDSLPYKEEGPVGFRMGQNY